MSKEKLAVRELQILEFLKKSKNQQATSEELARFLSVSTRTVKKDIQNINAKFNHPIQSSAVGYRLINEVHSETDSRRSNLILKYLLNAAEPLDLDELAENLYISKPTLIHELTKLNLISDELFLSRFNNKVILLGSERNKQKVLMRLLTDELPNFTDFNLVNKYFEDIHAEEIYTDFITILDQENYNLIDTYLYNIVLNIVIAFTRIKNGFHTETEFHSASQMEVRIAEQICSITESKEDITFSANDIQYVASLLIGQLRPKYWHQLMDAERVNELISEQFIKQIKDILELSFNYYMLDVDIDSFLNTFVIHVDQLIQRCQANNLAVNSMAYNIKQNCPFIYDVAVFIAHELGKNFSIHLNDSEIAYIAIHIGFAIENTESCPNKIRLLIICDNYNNVKQNILEKLKTNFQNDIELADVLTDFMIRPDVDLVLTTKNLLVSGVNILSISQLFTLDEQYNLKKRIDCLKQKKQNECLQKELLSCFNRNLFFRNIYSFHDKFDMIEFLGQKAIQYQVMDRACLESVKEREKISSTTFGDKFSIPHPLDISGLKSMFVVLINDKPVKWGDVDINAIFMISISKEDRYKFNRVYNSLTKILVDQNKFIKLISASDYDSFINILSNLIKM